MSAKNHEPAIGLGNWTIANKPANMDVQELTIWEHFEKIDKDSSGIETVLEREDGQNHLDRQEDGSKPVKIRYYFSGTENALSSSKSQKYFSGLGEHLEASSVVENATQIFSTPCQFITIECFGTSGLKGNEEEDFQGEGDAENHFWSFFRAFGRSGNAKDSGKGGSWGVGKSVYFYASEIRTILGLSIREHPDVNRKRVLMGKSVMRFHEISGSRFVNTGYLGQVRENDGFVLPFYDDKLLDTFCKDFNLIRKDELGLSIVIPFCEAMSSEEFLHAIVSEYGGSILSGRLEVTLELPGQSPIEIKRETLFSVLDNQPDVEPWIETKALLTLLLDGESMPATKIIQLPEISSGKVGEDIELFADIRERMSIALQSYEAIRVEVPVLVTNKDGSTGRSKFRIYMQQVEQRVGIYPVFYRDALRISGIRQNREISGVRTVFIADGEPGNRSLAELLRLAEGPSHTEWKSREKAKNNFQHVPGWLKLCIGMPKRLVSLVRASGDEPNNQSFAELFPDPSEQPRLQGTGSGNSTSRTGRITRGTRGGGGGGGGEGGGEREVFQVTPLLREHGFTIKIAEGMKAKKTFTIELAYARSRGGGSFTKWSPLDFTVKQLSIKCDGGSIKRARDNQIVVEIKNPKKLCLTVTGFDTNRSPSVKISQRDATK